MKGNKQKKNVKSIYIFLDLNFLKNSFSQNAKLIVKENKLYVQKSK